MTLSNSKPIKPDMALSTATADLIVYSTSSGDTVILCNGIPYPYAKPSFVRYNLSDNKLSWSYGENWSNISNW